MKNPAHRRAPQRSLLLLLLLPIGCLLVRDGEADPVAAAPPAAVFQPPFGPAVVPVDAVTLSREGGVVQLSSGTDITVPEDAFVTAEGQPVTGPVTLTIREFLNPIETWLGGVPMNMGDDAVLRSAGMMEIRGTTANGEQVELAPDKALQLDWYSVDPDPGYVSWALDTATGQWSETGGPQFLSTRDLDAELDEAEAALPPRVNPVPPTRYAFDIGDMTGKQPELARYRGVQFVPADGKKCGHDATRIEVEPITDGSGGAFLVRFIVDTVLSARFKASSFDTTTYRSSWKVDTTTVCRCNIALPPGADEQTASKIQRLLNGESDRKRDRALRKALELWAEYNAKVERQFLSGLLRPGNLPEQLDRPGRIWERNMSIPNLGWVNCDIVIPYPDEVDIIADFVGPDGQPVNVENLTVLEMDTRTLFPCKNNRIRLDPAARNVVFGYADGEIALLDDTTISSLDSSGNPAQLVITKATVEDLQNPASTVAELVLGS